MKEEADKLFELARKGIVSKGALSRGLEILGYRADKKEWIGFLDKLLLVLGISFLAAGIIFFFAYNWSDLHRFVKFGMIQVALIVTISIVIKRGLDLYSSKVLMVFASLLVGSLLALYGQVYQTGADSYYLFFNWAILISVWVLIAKFTPLWMIFIVLINLSLFLYIDTVSSFEPIYILIILNLISFSISEYIYIHKESYKQRWLSNTINIFLAGLFIFIFLAYILFSRISLLNLLFILLYLLYLGGGVFIYKNRVNDLFNLTVILLSLIVIVTTWMGNLFMRGFGGFILLSIALIIQGWLMVSALKVIKKGWGNKDE